MQIKFKKKPNKISQQSKHKKRERIAPFWLTILLCGSGTFFLNFLEIPDRLLEFHHIQMNLIQIDIPDLRKFF